MKKFSEPASNTGEATSTSSRASLDSSTVMPESLPSEMQGWWQTFQAMGFPESRKQEMFDHFMAERSGNVMESSPSTNTSKSAAGLVRMERLSLSDPLVRLATAQEFVEGIIKLGYLSGHKVSRDRATALASEISKVGRWTSGELDLAISLIITDAELTKQISYERTIGIGVFAQAKGRAEVFRGRLHSYRFALEYASGEGKTIDKVFEPVLVGDEKRWRMK